MMPRYNMGQVLQILGRYYEAALLFQEAEAIEPNPARSNVRLGSLAADRRDHDQAARHYRIALAADPELPEAHHGLGLALLEQGRLDAAEFSLREALRIKPRQAAPWIVLARLQTERGDFDRACQSARTALGIDPKCADAYTLLANIVKGRLPDAEIEAMRAALDLKYLDDRTRARLNFSLAGVLDARRLYSRAAALFTVANALDSTAWSARGLGYEPDRHSYFIDRIIATFGPQCFLRGHAWGHPDPRPIFIVGLPRSGTTLTEQVLASHAKIHGAGELPDVQIVFESLPEFVGRPLDDPFTALSAVGPAAARVAARHILTALTNWLRRQPRTSSIRCPTISTTSG